MIVSDAQLLEKINGQTSKSVVFMRRHELDISILSTGENKEILFNEYKNLFDTGLHATIDNEFKIHTKKLLAPNTGTIHNHFKRIYQSLEGRNNDFNFTDSNNYIDFINYLRNAFLNGLDNVSFSKEYLSTDILYNPNTRYYIDFENVDNLPQLQFELSKPKIKRVTCNFIHDVKENDTETEYIIFFEKKDKEIVKYFLIDSVRYAVCEKMNGKFSVTNSIAHNFEKAPVTSASNSKMFTKEHFEIKKSVISDSLEDLRDWNLIKNQSKIYFYRNQTPMHFGLGETCNKTSDDGSKCSEGYIFVTNAQYNTDLKESITNQEFKRVACSACEKKKKEKMRLGKTIEIDQRTFFNNPKEVENLKELFGFVGTDVEMLRFSEEKLKNDLESIEISIIGHSNSITKESINEKQVKQNGESKAETLSSFADNVEHVEMTLYNLLGFGRYENSYLYSDVFLGRQYVFNEKQLVEEVKALRESNASIMLIKQKETEIVKSRYGYDKDLTILIDIVNAAIPLQDLSLVELIANKSFLNEQDYLFRLYSDKLIAYLNKELKNDSNFMLLSFEKQVQFVTEKFTIYLSKNIKENGENKERNDDGNGIETIDS